MSIRPKKYCLDDVGQKNTLTFDQEDCERHKERVLSPHSGVAVLLLITNSLWTWTGQHGLPTLCWVGANTVPTVPTNIVSGQLLLLSQAQCLQMQLFSPQLIVRLWLWPKCGRGSVTDWELGLGGDLKYIIQSFGAVSKAYSPHYQLH